jgi:hypothetical protein
MNTLTDAAPARDQLRELSAEGYPLNWLADRLGVSHDGLRNIRAGRHAHINTYTARLINRLHRALHNTDPTDHGVSRFGTSIALLTAGRNGWTTTSP